MKHTRHTTRTLALAALLIAPLGACHRATRTTQHTRVIHHAPARVQPHTEIIVIPACDLGHDHCTNQHHFLHRQETIIITEHHTSSYHEEHIHHTHDHFVHHLHPPHYPHPKPCPQP